MLEKLLSSGTFDDFVGVGNELLDTEKMGELQQDIRNYKVVVNEYAYWTKDKFSIWGIDELIAQARSEEMNARIVHTLQILQHCCPVLKRSIDGLLSKITC